MYTDIYRDRNIYQRIRKNRRGCCFSGCFCFHKLHLYSSSGIILTRIISDVKLGWGGSQTVRKGNENGVQKKKGRYFFHNVQGFCGLTRGMGESFSKVINDYGNAEEQIAELKTLESECDVKKHKILGQLNESFITPFDREDIVLIADQLDDIADYMEDIANKFVIYDVKVLREDAVEMGNIIVESTLHVKIIFDGLADSKKSDTTKAAIIEINRLENIADAIFRRAIAKLFREEKDPVEIIRWNGLYEGLEDALDACEHLADSVEGVMMKNA